MGRFIPVDPEKWAAMVIAQSDLVRYKEICDELDAECTRLKDENARLRSFCTRTIIPNIDLEKEITRLKAEVERLTKQNALATPRSLIASQDIKTLREQIEELTLENSQYEEHHKYGQNVIASLREEVEQLTVARNYFIHKMMQKIKEVDRLTKAVMHSPAAQIKLKELEGKTTYEEINPDNQ